MRSGEETLLAAVMHLSHDADPARTCVYAFFFLVMRLSSIRVKRIKCMRSSRHTDTHIHTQQQKKRRTTTLTLNHFVAMEHDVWYTVRCVKTFFLLFFFL